MIIIRVSGGLGNQLFQYALGRQLYEQTGETVKLDISNFHPDKQRGVTQRDFSLDHFAIILPTTNFFENVWRKIKTDVLKIMRVVQDTTPFVFDPSLSEKAHNAYIVGNWVNPGYFSHVRNALLKELILKNPLSDTGQGVLNEIRDSESVSVHVRRGDYLNYQDKFVILGEEYYRHAVAIIKERTTNPKFFVFSDDSTYVKEKFGVLFGENVVYVSQYNFSDFEDLSLMSACKHNIIANSSFSWWGAWLNQNQTPTVVAPKKYRADNADDSQIMSTQMGWIQI